MLDFSNLDGDLNTEGHQAMRFIGTGQFTGHAGELRYVTEDHYGLDLPATHDEDGVGWRATTVCLREIEPAVGLRTSSSNIQTTPIHRFHMDQCSLC